MRAHPRRLASPTPGASLAWRAACLVACLGGAGCGGGGNPADGSAGVDASAAGGACGTCILHGQWRLANLSPCFFQTQAPDGGVGVLGAVSSTIAGGVASCPMDFTKPQTPFSESTVTLDCPGHYTLCYTFKGGSASAPSDGDCVMARTCVEGDYATAAAPQAWPALPAWATSDAQTACANRFFQLGGYGEMSATGTASGCGTVSKVMARVTYCPLTCNSNPNAPGCAGCQQGGDGKF